MGYFEPLYVKGVSCAVGLRVATSKACALHVSCSVAKITWRCRSRELAPEFQSTTCLASTGRRVRFFPDGGE
jgi:hypothetical protein